MHSLHYCASFFIIITLIFATTYAQSIVIPIVRRFQFNDQRTDFEPLKPSHSVRFGDSRIRQISLKLPQNLLSISNDDILYSKYDNIDNVDSYNNMDNANNNIDNHDNHFNIHGNAQVNVQEKDKIAESIIPISLQNVLKSLSTPLKIQFRIDNHHLTPWAMLIDPIDMKIYPFIHIDIYGHRKNQILNILLSVDESKAISFEHLAHIPASSAKINPQAYGVDVQSTIDGFNSFSDKADIVDISTKGDPQVTAKNNPSNSKDKKNEKLINQIQQFIDGENIHFHISYSWKHVSKDLASDLAMSFIYLFVIVLLFILLITRMVNKLGEKKFSNSINSLNASNYTNYRD